MNTTNSCRKSRILMSILWGAALSVVAAERPATSSASQPATSRPAALTVAVLDFAADTPGQPELGTQIAEALTVMLSGEPGFSLVDRTVMTRSLQEHELSLSGVVQTDQAVKIGRIVGARLLVVGKAFPMGKQLFVTAKLVGTETSLVDGVIVKGPLDSDVGEQIIELAQKVATRLREVGPSLVADEDAEANPLPALKVKLEGVTKPTIAVIIPERHMTRVVPAPDPAVETELKHLLIECGFTIKDVKQNELADFARTFGQRDAGAWPRELAGVDVVIVGEAFSEFTARIGNLVCCAGRAEVNVISRATGQIELAERATERGVDLSENIAGKSALQKAGRVIGLRILEHFCEQPERAKTTRP